jgi:predicted negative regulator of RcsB-dependent stress response
MKGALAEAETAVADAERFAQQHPNSGMDWSLNGDPLGTAKAFLLEKKGDLNGAAAAYEAILARLHQDGWPNSSRVISGRLAVIASLKGDDTAARRWSEGALSFDPCAATVLGSLLEKNGDKKGAKERYELALKLMNDAKKEKNWTLPIYFAEYKRAKEGLEK